MSNLSSKISVIIITHNEESNIEECLKSINWIDEIIIVDSQSTDKTVSLAQNYTKNIFIKEWLGYSAAKNFALQQCKYDWVLWLDADERITPELAEEIKEIINIQNNNYSGYEVARRAYFLGKWIKHCGWYPGYVTRLFKKENVKFDDSAVHEKIIINGEISRLKNDLLHFTDDNLYHYLHKFNRYTSLAVEDLTRSRKIFSIYDIIVRPTFLFFKMYFIRKGFLDGMHGFILSLLSASYVFVKYAKLAERKK
ncbi:MAG: glycosyltransferase family 2 protein [Ignavibacteriales bacterium]|nr:glycosyltransferase family 2 protein [Ignavibacteriales bacterium]